jgi:hypothetical protein
MFTKHRRIKTLVLSIILPVSLIIIMGGLMKSMSVRAAQASFYDTPSTATTSEQQNPRPSTTPGPNPSTPIVQSIPINPTAPDSTKQTDFITYHYYETLAPGESVEYTMPVTITNVPIGKGDILFVFDRTSSMFDEIAQAKTSATQIMNNIRSQLNNSWFGVASFMDYPGYFTYPGYANYYGDLGSGDTPWEVNIQPTDNITDVSANINSLWLGYGVDWPEDYTRVLYESMSINWRQRSKKIIVLFGDAPTHDLDFAGYNFGGDPGRDGIAQTSDDLDFETVVKLLSDQKISVIAVDSGNTPESAATFLGMSTGYGTANGTNGQYFNLSDASQIPDIVVNLIKKETENIDRLWLDVTPAYEDWVEFIPTEYTDVSNNTVKTFKLKITVPDGTTPGFYPFMIQVIGDDTIVQVAYVDITVPTDHPLSDLGFRPSRDGFKFSNFGKETALGLPDRWYVPLSWDMFEQFYGANQVLYPNGNRIHAADIYYQQHYRTINEEGHCDGMSATSMLNYKALDQPNAGNFALAQHKPLIDVDMSNDVRDALAFAQGIQTSFESKAYRALTCQGNSPSAFYRLIKSLIQNNTSSVVGISWDDFKVLGLTILPAGGHALTPYRFEEPSSDKAYVYVYDSNDPKDDDRKIEFNFSNDTWSYNLFDIWKLQFFSLSGDKNSCKLTVVPLDMYRHPGVGFWKTTLGASPASALAATQDNQFITTTGPGRLLLTDDEGRHLGWLDGVFYDEIPGATYVPTFVGASSDGFYLIPPGTNYNIDLVGSGVGQANMNMWTGDALLQLTHLDVITGTAIAVQVGPNNNGLKISGIVSDTQGTLAVNQALDGQDQTVQISNLALGAGDEIDLAFGLANTHYITPTSLITLTTNSLVPRTYDMALQRSGGDGYEVFGHSGMVLDANSNAMLSIQDWSSLDNISLNIDLNKDGYIDQVITATNQTQPHSILLDPSRTIVHTGGEKVNIIIEVRDQYGNFVADGTNLNLHTSLGTLSTDKGTTEGGVASFNLISGNQEGEATVTVSEPSTGIQSTIKILFEGYENFLPMLTK